MNLITAFLNSTNFYSYSGISASDVNSAYVDFLIGQFNAAINQKLGRLFQFTPNFTNKYYKRNSTIILPVGNWQQAGVVASIAITAGGSGYTSVPTVTISGNARAEAVIVSGVVTRIDITYQGYGYTVAPTVTISGGAGSGATATATISTLDIKRGEDDSVNLTDMVEGTDYRVLYFAEKDPTEIYPVVAIKLYDSALQYGEFLKITGVYGYAPTVPAELMLEYQLYDLLKKAVLASETETSTGGKGKVASSSIDKVRVSFDTDSSYSTQESISSVNGLLDAIQKDYEANSAGYLPSVIG